MFNSTSPLPAPSAILSLSDFYRATHTYLLSLASSQAPSTPPPTVTIVMGNESSDFDSTISASVLAWYLHSTSPSSSLTSPSFLPLINVPRRHFHLRTEIASEYTRLGLDPAHVSFIDDIDLPALARRCDLRLVLTDHNRLAASQESLAPHVVGVVDHHVDEGLYERTKGSRVMGKVGSCCTLVTNLIQDHHPALLTSSFALHPIVALLTDAVLIDTHNMAPDLTKGTAEDARALAYLTKASHTLLFSHLKGLRNDVAGWSTEALLLKDSKVYSHDGYTVMISTVPTPLDDWQRRAPRMIDELTAQAKQLDGLIVLTSFTDQHTKAYKRDLLLLVPRHPRSVEGGGGKKRLTPEELFEVLAKGLEGDDALKLKAVDTTRPVAGLADGERSAVSGLGAVEVGGKKVEEEKHDVLVRRYDQLNVKSSRKQVAPQIEAILSRL